MKVTELGREVVDIHVEYDSVRMIEKVELRYDDDYSEPWTGEDDDRPKPATRYGHSMIITYTGTAWHTLQAEVYEGGEVWVTLQENPTSPVIEIPLWEEHRDALISLLQDARNEL